MKAPTEIYKKDEIIIGLGNTFKEVSQMVIVLEDEEFYRRGGEKWSVAENLDHLIRSTKGLGAALKMPKLCMQVSFGKANRASRTFDEVVTKYQKGLKGGIVASGPYIPNNTTSITKANLLENWQTIGGKFQERLAGNWTEEQLDKYVIPHPAIGKLTVREIMFFTIYHNLHHLKNMKNLFASFV